MWEDFGKQYPDDKIKQAMNRHRSDERRGRYFPSSQDVLCQLGAMKREDRQKTFTPVKFPEVKQDPGVAEHWMAKIKKILAEKDGGKYLPSQKVGKYLAKKYPQGLPSYMTSKDIMAEWAKAEAEPGHG